MDDVVSFEQMTLDDINFDNFRNEFDVGASSADMEGYLNSNDYSLSPSKPSKRKRNSHERHKSDPGIFRRSTASQDGAGSKDAAGRGSIASMDDFFAGLPSLQQLSGDGSQQGAVAPVYTGTVQPVHHKFRSTPSVGSDTKTSADATSTASLPITSNKSRRALKKHAAGYLCGRCGKPKRGHICSKKPVLVSQGTQMDPGRAGPGIDLSMMPPISNASLQEAARLVSQHSSAA